VVRRFTSPVLAAGSAALLMLWWAAATTAVTPDRPAPATIAASSEDGAAIYAAECSTCHGVDAEGGLTQPNLHGLPISNASIESVAAIVRDGRNRMDPMAGELSEAEIAAVSSYVVNRWGAVGDVALGGELFRLNCAGCHGAAGRGGALIYSDTNAPSLATGSDAITVGAIRKGPGTMPAFNEAVLDSRSVASIAEYLHVIREPSRPGGLAVPPAGPVTEGLLAGLFGLGAALILAAWVTRGGRG